MPNERAEPIPSKLERLSKKKKAKLSQKIEADKKSKLMLDNEREVQYYRRRVGFYDDSNE